MLASVALATRCGSRCDGRALVTTRRVPPVFGGCGPLEASALLHAAVARSVTANRDRGKALLTTATVGRVGARENFGTHRSDAITQRCELLTQTADPDELFGVETRPADQRAVDVGLLHDAGHVAVLDRAAVDDADPVGRAAGVLLGQPRPDRPDDLLGVLRRGRLAGADRPHRLVGDHDLLDLVGLHLVQRAVELAQRVR